MEHLVPSPEQPTVSKEKDESRSSGRSKGRQGTLRESRSRRAECRPALRDSKASFRKESAMQPDPMNTMLLCSGHCDGVPDEVCDAVFASIKSVRGRDGNERDAC